LARLLIARGERVALLGRTESALRETASNAPPDAVLVLPLDLTDRLSPQRAIDSIRAAWGGLDALVNNAGVTLYRTVENTADSAWDELLEVNLSAPFRLVRSALPALREGSSPVIVNVASTLGVRGLSNAAAYCAAKGGLVNLTRALAVELAKQGIRVNAVLPGVIDTPMLASERPGRGGREALIRKLAALHPIGRIGTPEEVAAAIGQLLDPAGSFVTGALLAVDGGLLAGTED
jgi:NAD(P)-dependent dehydrogenase (short-subunit alcohol dehydrogenase family)